MTRREPPLVGIAGGVKEKAALGDVVVSQYAHSYPPAKRKPKGVEHRDRQFTSDFLLYARAQHYEAAEWKGDIGSPRPDAGGETKLPDVKFGPIACGEEVIADHKALAALQRQCPAEKVRTNNHVERANRGFRFTEQQRYKGRRRQWVVRFVLLELDGSWRAVAGEADQPGPEPETGQPPPPVPARMAG